MLYTFWDPGFGRNHNNLQTTFIHRGKQQVNWDQNVAAKASGGDKQFCPLDFLFYREGSKLILMVSL